jgi:uncharacterized membrane protein
MEKPERRGRVDTKLRVRLGIFLLISIILFGVVAFDVFQGYAQWWLAGISILIGLGIGYILGRLVNVRWHETEEKVITQMDTVGAIAIGAYILLAISRNYLLGEFFTGTALTTITFAAVAGILLGRFLGVWFSIRRTMHSRV